MCAAHWTDWAARSPAKKALPGGCVAAAAAAAVEGWPARRQLVVPDSTPQPASTWCGSRSCAMHNRDSGHAPRPLPCPAGTSAHMPAQKKGRSSWSRTRGPTTGGLRSRLQAHGRVCSLSPSARKHSATPCLRCCNASMDAVWSRQRAAIHACTVCRLPLRTPCSVQETHSHQCARCRWSESVIEASYGQLSVAADPEIIVSTA